MPAATPDLVQTARDNLAAARVDIVKTLYDFEKARDELRELKRKSAAYTGKAQQVDDLEQLYKEARSFETTQRSTLWQQINDWLPAPTADASSAAADVGRLSAAVPILLFPLRIETRFDGSFLKIRVNPDEILLNIHEKALTDAEAKAGRAYHEALLGGTPETALWRDIVKRYGAPRAAYIVRVTQPYFDFMEEILVQHGGPGGDGPPQWPGPDEILKRSSSWTRPGEAILPDRLVVYTYNNGVRSAPIYGNPILEPIQLTPDPKMRGEEPLEYAPGRKIDPRLEWTLNFDGANDREFSTAVKVGLGISIPLTPAEQVSGFERIVVLGIKSSLDKTNARKQVEALFEAQHFTSGLAIVQQGAPTNNTEGRPTGYPLQENAGEKSYLFERYYWTPILRHDPNNDFNYTTFDCDQISRFLGLRTGVLRNIDRSGYIEGLSAQNMNQALWPATLGFFLQYLMAPAESGAAPNIAPALIANARSYFSRYVLARGPMAAIRVGSTPYGFLPAVALSPWTDRSFGGSDTEDDAGRRQIEVKLIDPLRRVFDVWRDASAQVPRIRANQPKPDVDVANVLSIHPDAREFRVRRGLGMEVQGLFGELLGFDLSTYASGFDQQCGSTFGFLGHGDWRPRIGRVKFDADAPIYPGEIVATPVREDAGLTPNFITGIRTAQIHDLNDSVVVGKPAAPNLLYDMLRHSTMTEYFRVYNSLVSTPIFDIYSIPSLIGPSPSLPPLFGLAPSESALPGIKVHQDALQGLEILSTAELDRLFRETLDVTSHRLDAWVTSLATARLTDMRRVGDPEKQNNYFGAYGWVEDVRPEVRPVVSAPGLGSVPTQLAPGGFIQAPTMAHASAAAVLRSGHLSVRGENGTATAGAYAVDLSSARVRSARRIFDGMRNGQPLGALLGYEFERGLHERHSGVQGLDTIRFAIRKLCPLVANQDGQDTTEPAETIAARNVVDGNVLLLKRSSLVWGTQGLPAVGSQQYLAVQAELDRVAAMFDATADLVTAEGVYQLVRGSPDGAAPALNNLPLGEHPPETVISRSHRSGVGIAHRVALIFPADGGPELDTSLWTAPATPRAIAEPKLNAWVGGLIGDPALLTAKIKYLNSEGEVITSTSGGTPKQSVTVTLAELALHPLDVLALAEVVAQTNLGSMLDRRLIGAALADPNKQPDSAPARFEIVYAAEGPDKSFLDLMEVLNTATRLLAESRMLTPADLLSPADVAEELEDADTPGDANGTAFYGRATAVIDALVAVRDALDFAIGTGTGLRETLIRVAGFLSLQAVPDPLATDAELLSEAHQRLEELEDKLSVLTPTLKDEEVEDTLGSELVRLANVIFSSLFGANFRALPPVAVPGSEEVGLSLGARSTLLNGDDEAPDRYLQQAMRARKRLGLWRKLGLYARTAGQARPRVSVAQFPYQPGERWLGLPADDPEISPEEGRVALLLLNYETELDADDAWSGLVIDDWIEIVPQRTEDTGIAFNYVSPRAKAPQTMLVVAPASASSTWVWEEIVQSVEQALDLAKMRAVDRDLVGLGQLIPAAVLPSNENPTNSVTTEIVGLVSSAIGEAGLEG